MGDPYNQLEKKCQSQFAKLETGLSATLYEKKISCHLWGWLFYQAIIPHNLQIWKVVNHLHLYICQSNIVTQKCQIRVVTGWMVAGKKICLHLNPQNLWQFISLVCLDPVPSLPRLSVGLPQGPQKNGGCLFLVPMESGPSQSKAPMPRQALIALPLIATGLAL